MLLAVPASVGIFALSEQIIAVLFERGEFNENSSLFTSKALKFYSLGLVAFILMKIYTPIFFAYENARPTLHITATNLDSSPLGVDVEVNTPLFDKSFRCSLNPTVKGCSV